jgi:Zn-dependent peptidase ImmA (M78 family)
MRLRLDFSAGNGQNKLGKGGKLMSRVAVATAVLRWALERAGRSEDDLQKNRKFSKIREWLSGETQPTLRQLENLAKATWTPLGFLFLQKPPDERLPVPHYRTLGDDSPRRPSPNLLETIQTMQRRQSWMREFLIDEGQERLPFVKSMGLHEQPTSTAQRMRHTLGLDAGWAGKQPTWSDALRVLREAMEENGIMIVVNGIVGNNTHRKLDPSEFRGFVLVDEYAPLMFVNGADGKAAQMFTVAHELAHVFFGSSAAFDLRELLPADNPTEQACNRVAAEFLVPELELRRTWQSAQNSPEPFQAIARQFKVSVLVVARRAMDLALISRKEFLEFYREYQDDERRKPTTGSEGGDFYLTQNLRVGRRFASAIVHAAKEGKLLYSEAYQLTGLYGQTFDRYAASLDIGGMQ